MRFECEIFFVDFSPEKSGFSVKTKVVVMTLFDP
jgi:hypothetical protein